MFVAAEDLTVAPPVGGAFAGAMYDVYSMGNGESCARPCRFLGHLGDTTEIRQAPESFSCNYSYCE